MFKRIANLIKGFFSLFISKAEAKNPEALLEVEKENLRKQISQYNQSLASHAGMVERLINQIEKEEKREKEYRAKAAAHLKAQNQEAAGQYALRLQEVRSELEENRAQLEAAENTYKELVRARDVSIKEAKQKIENLKYQIQDMKVKQATAELQEMASGMISEIGGSGDTLNRLESIVSEQRDKAAGRARVARDSLELSEVDLKENEQKAMADMALADLASELGMSVKAPPKESTETDGGEAQDESPQTEKEGM